MDTSTDTNRPSFKTFAIVCILVIGLIIAVIFIYNAVKKPSPNPPYPTAEIQKRDSIIAADKKIFAQLQEQKELIKKQSDSLLQLNAVQDAEIKRLAHSNEIMQQQKKDIAGRINNAGFTADSVLNEYLNFKSH
jgi:hypothetical protein